jgi:hypothetical protein
MCDDLGIDDTKVTVYQFSFLGQNVIHESIDNVLDFIADEVDNIDDGDSIEIEIKKMTMTRSQIKSLPEFDGY